MSVSVHDVLQRLHETALDTRDKGDRFERLVLNLLRTEPEWVNRFSHVWLWSEWPGREGRTDTGVDLVARHRDREGYAAIQCKFYAATHRVSKGDLDTFLSASGAEQFVSRYFFDTADNWNANATATAEHQAVPVHRVDLAYLNEAKVDWSQYSWSTPDVLVPTGPKRLRPHQERALRDVRAGLEVRDRGKLIMACGTGKTFTSLKIAEELVGAGGKVLFLVPSIQLLSQSLREWMQEAEVAVRPFAVCSDVRVGRRASQGSDFADSSVIDLTEPATTDAATLVARMAAGRHSTPRMTVVFSTYQSIDVVARAQEQGLGDFDLIVCDEAHRTTGVTLADSDESHFVKVHDNEFLHATRRLYMTATPRVFGEEVRRRAADAEAVLADMNDETTFGPELHRLGFGDAVEADLLTDYKVLVLAVDEQYVAENFQSAMATSGEIALNDAAKLIGCWNGLAKNFGDPGRTGDGDGDGDGVPPGGRQPAPMRRAVAFAKDIRASEQASASFPVLVDRAIDGDPGCESADDEASPRRRTPRVQAVHVDGTMGVQERNRHLAWLSEDLPDGVCRVLTNARCLSEGVDVPALDAVMFLTPRGSQVDVVQSVGRVMRREQRERRGEEQLTLSFDIEAYRDAMFARIVAKVGERKYWERWASDVADIARAHIVRINGLLADPGSAPAQEFAAFLTGLRGNLNEQITSDEAVEMLAQHLITRPIFEALFGSAENEQSSGYDFALHNPVAQTMELMLASLDDHNLAAEQASLDQFYASVRRRVEGVSNAEGKQRVIVELYDKFFATAFKRTVDRLGIVYTPIEIVDFILSSADQVLREEFDQGLTDEGVHVLDGFTGTGTFIVRLLQSGLIEPRDLARKYGAGGQGELHANEMLLLAYYIAAVNIETTYAALANGDRANGDGANGDGDAPGAHEPFPGLVLTDTFQSYEDGDRDDLDIFPANHERIERQRKLPITVIVGNPPYSVGQDSANDDNANTKYPTIDGAIRDTYAARSTATNKNSLYDSYIRAVKWASLRIADRGVVAFVTNGGFLDANTADGMRLSLAEEFSTIHVLNLRGNARTAGEQRKKEGGTAFGGGSRATVAVTVLVKNPGHTGPARIRYTDIGDYLTREEKLARVAEAGGVAGLDAVTLTANQHGDWVNQRRDDFEKFMSLGDRSAPAIFSLYGAGLQSNRDAWVYNFDHSSLLRVLRAFAAAYNEQVAAWQAQRLQGDDSAIQAWVDTDPRRISWSRSLRGSLRKGVLVSVDESHVQTAVYRPFAKQVLYFDSVLNHERAQLPRMFPTPAHGNVGFYALNPGAEKPFSVMMLSLMPDLAFYGSNAGQFFSRWTWEPVDEESLDLGDDGEVLDGYRRVDNITDEALRRWQAAYTDEWPELSKDDIFYYCYGLLHSHAYRETYAADLKKMLPRIPLVATAADARAFADAGRRLGDLHIGYETAPPYPLDGLHPAGAPTGEAAYDFFAVEAKMRFGKATPEQRAAGERADRSVIHFNDRVTVSGIPEEAYRYLLGSRSAVEWIIDRYHVRTDKASGIVNDPNDWSREVGDPRYVLDLLARIVTVSLETMRVVDALPALVVEERRQ